MENVEIGLKKGLKLHHHSSLTPTQIDIKNLLTSEFLTIKQIAHRRKTSIQAVYKVRKQLIKLGEISIGNEGLKNSTHLHKKRDIRLHGQEINIKIIYQNPTYQRLLNKSNTVFIDGNTIRLYKNAIEIYCGKSFYGKTTEEVDNKSLNYIQRLLLRLENDFKVVLVKNRARNIRIVNQHYARGDSELSEKAHDERNRVWVYAEEDGRLAFITDDSFGFKEDETVHPTTGKKDREAIDKQINDWRINNPPTNSQLSTHILQVTQNQAMFNQNFESHVSAVRELGSSVRQLTKQVIYLQEENKKIRNDTTKKTKEM